MGDRICLLNAGSVEQIGTPEEFLSEPKNDFVRDFIGDIDSHMLKQSTAGDIVRNAPEIAEGDEDGLPEVSHEADMYQLFKYFSEHEKLVIVDEKRRKLLKREDMFKYLSNDEGGDHL